MTKTAGRELTLGYSPCPNDTFIFYGLVHGKVAAPGLRFREVLLDVETLNQKACQGGLDVTKVSFHAFGHLRDQYAFLSSGAALGRGCGPLLVARNSRPVSELRGKRVAIPGRLTTAFLLLRLFDPEIAADTVVMPFHLIPEAVRDGTVEAGLIIHESRFTYPSYGLFEVEDLGRWWERETGMPIPLGCIIAKKGLGADTKGAVETLVRESVKYAFSHREEARGYIRRHAREIEEDVIERHINLYVNDFTLDLGDEGRAAVAELFRRAGERGLFKEAIDATVR